MIQRVLLSFSIILTKNINSLNFNWNSKILFTIKAIPNPNLSFILRVDWSKATTAAAAHGFLQHNFIDKGSRRQRNFALLLVKTCSKDYNTFWIMVKGQKAWKQIFNSAVLPISNSKLTIHLRKALNHNDIVMILSFESGKGT